MATITADLTDISTADSTTGWSGTSGQLDQEVFKQRTTGTGGAYTYQTGRNSLSSCTFTPATNINMTANYTTPHLYWTMRCDVFTFCEALNTGTTNSGLMVRVTDGSGNYTQWHVAGSDTWDGSWKTWVLDLTNTANVHTTSGTLSLTDVDIITWYTDNSNSGNIRIIDNTWLDAVRYGDGLIGRSTTTENIDFGDYATADALVANYYGVTQLVDGVIFAQGGITIGDTTNTTNFNSSGETVYFRDQIVSSSHYAITAVAGTSNTTNVTIDGLVTKTIGGTGAEVAISDPNLTSLSLTNSSFSDMGAITFGLGTASNCSFTNSTSVTLSNCDATSCNFNTGGAVTLTNAGTVTSCGFTKTTAASSVITTDADLIEDCTFNSDGSNHAVEITAVGTGSMTWNSTLTGYVAGTTGTNVTTGSTGNEAIYLNFTSSATFTINVSGGTIPSVRKGAGMTGNVDVVQSTTVTITQLQDDTEVRVMQAGSNTVELAGTDNATDGTAGNRSFSFSLASGTSVDIYIVNVLYENVEIYGYTIPASAASLPQQQRFDRNYLNPPNP